MHYSTVFVGMDVHKETFSLCCFTNEKGKAEYPQKLDAYYSKVINYFKAMCFHYGDDVLFICGYKTGSLGFTLYHELTAHNISGFNILTRSCWRSHKEPLFRFLNSSMKMLFCLRST